MPRQPGAGAQVLNTLTLIRRDDFDEVRAFARKIAAELARTDPRHLTLEVRKNKRAGRIFINAYAQTAAPPYAIRPRRGAPVAAPLEWTELEDPRLRPDRYTIRNIFDRLERKGDVWKNLNRHARGL